MSGYRLYLMSNDGHIAEAVELECADDADALTHADQKREGRPAELWQRARVVAKLPKRQDA